MLGRNGAAPLFVDCVFLRAVTGTRNHPQACYDLSSVKRRSEPPVAVARPAVSTMSLTASCEAEEVHKKGRVLCGRCSLARSPPLWPQGAGDSPSLRRARHAQTIECNTVASFRFEFVTRQYVYPNRHFVTGCKQAKWAHVQGFWTRGRLS